MRISNCAELYLDSGVHVRLTSYDFKANHVNSYGPILSATKLSAQNLVFDNDV